MNYKIPVVWQSWALMDIEADSLEDAISKADDAPLPTDGEYIDDSFEVDEDGIEFHNIHLENNEVAIYLENL